MIIITYIKLFYLSLLQDSLIFKPHPKNVEQIVAPNNYGFEGVSEIELTSGNSEKIYLWQKGDFSDEGKKTFVFFHGNTGHIADVGKPEEGEEYDRRYRLNLLKEIEGSDNNFIAVSLRGYGKSEGKPSEENFAEDIKNISEYITENKLKNIYIIGESLGANSALKLNEALSKNNQDVQKTILIAPFSSLVNAVISNYPEFEKVKLQNWLKHRLDNQKVLNNSKSNSEFIIFHSKDDETTNISHSKLLFKTAKDNNLNVKFIELEKAGHINWQAKQIITEALK